MSQTAIVAGGCFWGMEAKFQKLAGVLDTEVGYIGGHVKDPTYREVCQDKTGHVEAVKIEFDPSVISYTELIQAFFDFHDPTLCDDNCRSQSSQYRSIIFAMDKEQEKTAQTVLSKIKNSDKFECRVVTTIRPSTTFYLAEEYHQNYYKKHNLMEDHNEIC